MRDILTALAGVLVLLLVAALAVPPFVAWDAQRSLIDGALSRSLGLPARSEGRIDLRLLPSPRLRFDRLHLGESPARPGLDLHFVKAEVALTPLIKGEVRFTEARIGRAELRLPVTEGEAIRVPADLAAGLDGRDLAIDDLQVRQFLVTTQVPATGRTDQFYAEAVRLSAPRLTGPWRVEGTSRGVGFRLSTGEATPEGMLPVKLSAGGDTQPYGEIDAKLSLAPAPSGTAGPGERAVIPEAEGTARFVVGPPTQAAGAYLPVQLGGAFTARGTTALFTALDLDVDPGGRALRLSGTGRVDLRNGRAALALGARRLDLDAFLLSAGGQALLSRGFPKAGAGLPLSVEADLTIEALSLGLDDWQNLTLAGTFERSGGVLLKRFSAVAPGGATLSASGEIDREPAPRFTGRIGLDAPASEGFGRYLRKLGVEGPGVALLDGRAVRAEADLSAEPLSVSLRNLRLDLGTARVTGNARYRAPEAGARGRVDAQLAAQGLDIAALPSFSGALAELQGHDFGLVLQARDVRYGATGSGNGTIAASIQSNGASLAIDSLDVTDLAGARASLSGRIDADGAGRIAGRIAAPVAAPLLALLDRVWVAEARLIPRGLRDGALDLAVTLERDAGAADTLRTTAKGGAAGGSLDLDLVSRGGRIGRLDLTLAAPSAATWFGRADFPGLAKPGRLHLTGTRVTEGETDGFSLAVTGTVADLTLSTAQPLLLGAEPGPPRGGELRLGSPDLAPFLRLAGTAPLRLPIPADLTVGLSREGDEARLALSGRLAGTAVSGEVGIAPEGEITGRVGLGRLSVPALAAALVLPREGDADTAFARFAAPPAPRPPIALDLTADGLDLGRGLVATGARVKARLDDGALSLTDLAGTLAGGRLTGSATLSRQGTAAAVAGEGALTDATLAGLVGTGPVSGRLSASLRFGTSGETPTALVNNLGGSGSLTLADLTLPGADPAGLSRALDRALAEDDPLREGRLQALVAEELGAGPLHAPGSVTTPVSLVGGTLRTGPVRFDLGGAQWTGTLGLDLRGDRLDARGTLTAATAPKAWTGAPPAIQLGFTGPVANPERQIDAGPSTTGLAALVLQRELESIEALEADQTERQRRRARIEMDKARAAAEKALADKAQLEKAQAEKVQAEEAARQARLKAAAEAARQARAREAEEASRAREAEQPVRPPGPDAAPPAAQP
ncbi:AsmA family protein [Methylobacterium gossipiicola]|uniref:AsmA family protein n=1 Tax=Methylobacterium gossipiicola TaxID=582675 RepID=A0A1I2XEN1_9HYPH|nr:AsmA family protein [Methylobacterium gossipiicola]SFH11943.1 AsmA family protein [Methylobacterium gossipiicola]